MMPNLRKNFQTPCIFIYVKYISYIWLSVNISFWFSFKELEDFLGPFLVDTFFIKEAIKFLPMLTSNSTSAAVILNYCV